MLESDFRKALQSGLKSQGYWVYKIPDLARAQVKPCDLLVSYNWQLMLIECKLTKFQRQKPLLPDDIVLREKDFRAHQLTTLQEAIDRQQGKGYVALCIAHLPPEGKITKRAWLIPASAMMFKPPREVTLGELEGHWGHSELRWVPAVGWGTPWMSDCKETINDGLPSAGAAG